MATAEHVLPVFVLDPALLASPYVGDKRVAFLLEGLRRLDQDLETRGSRLIVRRGSPRQALAQIVTESGANAILAEEDYSPYARRRDEQIARHLPLHVTGGLTVQPPGAIVKKDGDPYVTFTPFMRRWKAQTHVPTSAVLAAPDAIPTPDRITSEPIPGEPSLPAEVPFSPGEAKAQDRLHKFVDEDERPVYRYAETRDRLDATGTSRLSPYLRFGMLSARQAIVAALSAIEVAPNQDARESATPWLNELIWREFYIHILYHFPQVREQSFRQSLQSITWKNDLDAFSAWCQGQTGYPIVDAAMRQLSQTGWMHNRARMIVASFLTKDLLVDWRWGERWFMQHLVDGDPAANNGGWQWTAGTGTDAAPYFRIFNPILQSQKFDPRGTYIRRWLPELGSVPIKFIHEPWRMSVQQQKSYNCLIGHDYAHPIVDHANARQRAIKVYQEASNVRQNRN
jgi:deoxyribodipyrimidine photo-lyase